MTIFFPPHQEFAILFLVVTGFICGVFYDVLAVKRKLVGEQYIFLFVDDVVFVFFSAILFLVSVFAANNGIVRWYEFFGYILGFFVYKLTLSKLVMLVFTRLIIILKLAVVKIVSLVIRIALFLLSPIIVLISVAFGGVRLLSLPMKHAFQRCVCRHRIYSFFGEFKHIGCD